MTAPIQRKRAKRRRWRARTHRSNVAGQPTVEGHAKVSRTRAEITRDTATFKAFNDRADEYFKENSLRYRHLHMFQRFRLDHENPRRLNQQLRTRFLSYRQMGPMIIE